MAKVYTKTGDEGQTGLIGGSRVPKNHVRIEACGSLDEANALLGTILAQFPAFKHRPKLEFVQGMLFELGAVVADPQARNPRPQARDVEHLEQLIDELWAPLPPLTSFILPGGTQLAAQLHLLRTVVRQAERRVITVSQHQSIPPLVLQYLNRLSDYLFTLARAINHGQGVTETKWQPLES